MRRKINFTFNFRNPEETFANCVFGKTSINKQQKYRLLKPRRIESEIPLLVFALGSLPISSFFQTDEQQSVIVEPTSSSGMQNIMRNNKKSIVTHGLTDIQPGDACP